MPQGLRVEGVLGEGTDIPPPQFEVLEMPIQRRWAVGQSQRPAVTTNSRETLWPDGEPSPAWAVGGGSSAGQREGTALLRPWLSSGGAAAHGGLQQVLAL